MLRVAAASARVWQRLQLRVSSPGLVRLHPGLNLAFICHVWRPWRAGATASRERTDARASCTRQQAGRQAQPYSDQRAYCWPHMPAPRSAPSVRRFGAAQGWCLVTPRAAAARWAWRCKARNESKMASKMKSPKSQNGQVEAQYIRRRRSWLPVFG